MTNVPIIDLATVDHLIRPTQRKKTDTISLFRHSNHVFNTTPKTINWEKQATPLTYPGAQDGGTRFGTPPPWSKLTGTDLEALVQPNQRPRPILHHLFTELKGG
uniref:Uncharacterized protein n=1 Tax=Bionectria ochroleuca TaxID=29856 RepID=A0A0B7K3T6_BIOOC